MSWYGNYNEATKHLDALIDKQPSFKELLAFPEFILQLKAFNPRLLDYISHSEAIPREMVTYISEAPLNQDTNQRKYRLPLVTIQVIETETTCIVNSFLKVTGTNGQNYYQSLYNMFKGEKILPLLAGYFARVNYVLYRIFPREIIESVYSSPDYFQYLIKHSEHDPIAQCLCIFLNIESNKNIISNQAKLALKQNTVRKIMEKIEQESLKEGKDAQNSILIIENLCLVLHEMIEKYYLIADGKLLLEIVLEAKYAELVIGLISAQKEYSFPAMNIALMILKYYTYSSFNSDQGSEQLVRKNMERLQSQPFIALMCKNYSNLFKKVKQSPKFTLYHYKLTEVLCHCMTLSSMNMMNAIKQSELFPFMIELMFRNGTINIFHNLLERAIRHIIITDKKIFDKYRRYLFCEINIMDLTVRRLLDLFGSEDALEKAKREPYFGILMIIVKVYSGIETGDPLIKDAITSQHKIWNKASKTFIKPYQAIIQQNLGEIHHVVEPKPLSYEVKKTEIVHNLVQNILAMEEIKREEQSINKNLQIGNEPKKEQMLAETVTKNEQDTFFNVPIEESLERKKSEKQYEQVKEGKEGKEKIVQEKETKVQVQVEVEKEEKPKETDDRNIETKKEEKNFDDFLSRRKEEAGAEIKLKRTGSEDKRLSAGKRARITSPSPTRKRNSWKSDDEQQQPKKPQKKSLTSTTNRDLPKIPLAFTSNKNNNNTSMTKSTIHETKKHEQDRDLKRMSMSMADLDRIKGTEIRRVNNPFKEGKSRKVNKNDKILLQYIGVNL